MALNGPVYPTSGDLRQQLQRFSRALDQLGASKKRVDGAANRFARRSAAYFDVWNKQLPAIKDEELRKRSMARKAEVTSQYATTNRQHREPRILWRH